MLQQDLQRGEAVEARQRVVRQHQLGRCAGKGFAEVALGGDVPPLDVDTVLRELQLDQLGVVRVVFQQHEPQRTRTFLHNVRGSLPSVTGGNAIIVRRLWKMRIAARRSRRKTRPSEGSKRAGHG